MCKRSGKLLLGEKEDKQLVRSATGSITSEICLNGNVSVVITTVSIHSKRLSEKNLNNNKLRM